MSDILDVVYKVAHGYEGGVPALAARMGVNGDVLQNKINPNCRTHHLRLDEAATIADFAKSDDIAKAYASRRGLVCVRMANYDGLSDMELLDLFLAVEKEKGEWADEIRRALEDGKICKKEFKKIKEQYEEFCAALAGVMQRIESIVK